MNNIKFIYFFKYNIIDEKLLLKVPNLYFFLDKD